MNAQARDTDRIAEALDLTRAAAAGDRGARRRLVDRLLDRIGAAVRYLAPRDPDLEDHVQLALIEVLSAAGSFRGESSLETWAERIAIRTAMRQIRKRRFRAQVVTLDPEREGRSRDPAPEHLAVRHRMSLRISELLEDLAPERRQVLTLRLVMGYGIEEIASMTGMKVNTVRDRLAVARRQLRRRIERDAVLRDFRAGLGA
ncbi:MAG TPA: sigma-70 family RNA polymerase sigma factor [Polyangia bacterium]|nr:sigma-70 family RNA polymerase sigma factor [Polyangia bacterium]